MDWGYSPVVKTVLSMCEPLVSIPSIKRKKKNVLLILLSQSEGIPEWEKKS
jgi:hypothetical protein